MATQDKTYCGEEDRSHVDQGDDTRVGILSKALGVSPKDITDIMTQNNIGIDKVEEYYRNKQNSY